LYIARKPLTFHDKSRITHTSSRLLKKTGNREQLSFRNWPSPLAQGAEGRHYQRCLPVDGAALVTGRPGGLAGSSGQLAGIV
jgi:hypothetical protein